MNQNENKIIALNTQNVKTTVPQYSGVYLLYSSGTSKYFYVGQAKNLQERLLQHLSDVETNTCVRNTIRTTVCGFTFIEVNSQSERDRLEKSFYDKFDPTCNIAKPGGI